MDSVNTQINSAELPNDCYVNGVSLFHKIENDLGEITDFEILDNKGLVEINYKSNGMQKQILLTDKSKKIVLQSFVYCLRTFTHCFLLSICLLS